MKLFGEVQKELNVRSNYCRLGTYYLTVGMTDSFFETQVCFRGVLVPGVLQIGFQGVSGAF